MSPQKKFHCRQQYINDLFNLLNPVEVTLANNRPDMAVVPCANNRPGENENFQQSFKQV